MKYLLILLFMNIYSVWGMSLQNETAVAFPLSDLKERQAPSQEAIHKIGGLSTRSDDLQMFIRPKRVFGITAGVATLVGLASLGVGTANFLKSPGTNRNFVMRIENLLKLQLQNVKLISWWGYISTAPHNIRPCEVGSLAGHKIAPTATGTSGIVAWKIKEYDLTIIILWSIPFNGYKCNSLGLAIYRGLSSSEPSYGKRKQYFDDIYYYHENFPSVGENEPKTITTFCHRWHTKEICTKNAGIVICGTLSTSKSAQFDIKVAEDDDRMYCAGNSSNLSKPSQRPG